MCRGGVGAVIGVVWGCWQSESPGKRAKTSDLDTTLLAALREGNVLACLPDADGTIFEVTTTYP